MVTGAVKYAERKYAGKKSIAASFNVRKVYSIMERIDGCKSSIETNIVPLKEGIARTNFFMEIITQTSTDCKLSCQNKYSIL